MVVWRTITLPLLIDEAASRVSFHALLSVPATPQASYSVSPLCRVVCCIQRDASLLADISVRRMRPTASSLSSDHTRGPSTRSLSR